MHQREVALRSSGSTCQSAGTTNCSWKALRLWHHQARVSVYMMCSILFGAERINVWNDVACRGSNVWILALSFLQNNSRLADQPLHRKHGYGCFHGDVIRRTRSNPRGGYCQTAVVTANSFALTRSGRRRTRPAHREDQLRPWESQGRVPAQLPS